MTRIAPREFNPAVGIPKPEKAEKGPRKRMRRVSEKRQKHHRSEEGKADLEYMGQVKMLPCIICTEFGMIQATPTEAHHPIHGRFSAKKSPAKMCIPLCVCHHRGTAGSDKIALHEQPAKWKRLYGEDHEWSARTKDDVERKTSAFI